MTETKLVCYGNNSTFNQYMLCTASLLFFVKDMNYFYMTLLPFGTKLSDLHVFNAGIYEMYENVNRLGLKVKQ